MTVLWIRGPLTKKVSERASLARPEDGFLMKPLIQGNTIKDKIVLQSLSGGMVSCDIKRVVQAHAAHCNTTLGYCEGHVWKADNHSKTY